MEKSTGLAEMLGCKEDIKVTEGWKRSVEVLMIKNKIWKVQPEKLKTYQVYLSGISKKQSTISWHAGTSIISPFVGIISSWKNNPNSYSNLCHTINLMCKHKKVQFLMWPLEADYKSEGISVRSCVITKHQPPVKKYKVQTFIKVLNLWTMRG